jgi:hypothetical protein
MHVGSHGMSSSGKKQTLRKLLVRRTHCSCDLGVSYLNLEEDSECRLLSSSAFQSLPVGISSSTTGALYLVGSPEDFCTFKGNGTIVMRFTGSTCGVQI